MTVHHATTGPPAVAIAPDGTIHIYGPVHVLTGPAVESYVVSRSAI